METPSILIELYEGLLDPFELCILKEFWWRYSHFDEAGFFSFFTTCSSGNSNLISQFNLFIYPELYDKSDVWT